MMFHLKSGVSSPGLGSTQSEINSHFKLLYQLNLEGQQV